MEFNAYPFTKECKISLCNKEGEYIMGGTSMALSGYWKCQAFAQQSVRERERERERMCVCVCARMCTRVHVCKPSVRNPITAEFQNSPSITGIINVCFLMGGGQLDGCKTLI